MVTGSELLRGALEPVYAALELELGPGDRGQRRRTRSPGVGLDAVEEAILAELAAELELVEAELDPETLALAERLESGHLA